MFENGELFGVKDTKTGKQYDTPYRLTEDMKDDLLDIYKLFRPHQFVLDDEGDLFIEGSCGCDGLAYLDRKRFKVVWNHEHDLFKELVCKKRRENKWKNKRK